MTYVEYLCSTGSSTEWLTTLRDWPGGLSFRDAFLKWPGLLESCWIFYSTLSQKSHYRVAYNFQVMLLWWVQMDTIWNIFWLSYVWVQPNGTFDVISVEDLVTQRLLPWFRSKGIWKRSLHQWPQEAGLFSATRNGVHVGWDCAESNTLMVSSK